VEAGEEGRLLAGALEAEVEVFVTALARPALRPGHRQVVLNGHAKCRVPGHRGGPDLGPDPLGGRPSGRRGSCRPGPASRPKVAEVLPLMYLHGMMSGDFVPRPRGVLRIGCRSVGLGRHLAHRRLAEGTGTSTASSGRTTRRSTERRPRETR